MMKPAVEPGERTAILPAPDFGSQGRGLVQEFKDWFLLFLTFCCGRKGLSPIKCQPALPWQPSQSCRLLSISRSQCVLCDCTPSGVTGKYIDPAKAKQIRISQYTRAGRVLSQRRGRAKTQIQSKYAIFKHVFVTN